MKTQTFDQLQWCHKRPATTMGHVGLYVERDEDGDWFCTCRKCGYLMVWKNKERMRYLSVPVYGPVPANAVRTRMEFVPLWADLPKPELRQYP